MGLGPAPGAAEEVAEGHRLLTHLLRVGLENYMEVP
jgi:hypothetical protein